jgi:hypothetical protein
MRNPARHLDVFSCKTLVSQSQLAADMPPIAHSFHHGLYHTARDDDNLRYAETVLELNNRRSLGMGVPKVPGVAENHSRNIATSFVTPDAKPGSAYSMAVCERALSE